MDNSFQPRELVSDLQPHGRLANRLHIFKSILHWLSNLFQLTKEEQQDAGIYLGRLGDE